MIIKLTYFLFSVSVLACSDCFSKCTNLNKNECLLTCGCPIFSTSEIYGGSFQGSSSTLYVPSIESSLIPWVQATLSCNLECSEDCSNQYLDSQLESCLTSCGCSELLLTSNTNDSIYNKCESICRGSPASCALDCVHHLQGDSCNYYFWIVFPVLISIMLLAWFSIRQKKEDDYILM